MGFENNFVTDKQHGIDDLIKEQEVKSIYKRTELSEDNEILNSPEGEKYNIRLLKDANDPMVEKLHAFMLETFGEEEAIPLDWLQIAILENRDQIFIIEREGNIAAYMQSIYMEIGNNEALSYLCYTQVDKNYSKKSLVPELQLSMYKNYKKIAENKGQKITGEVAEMQSGVLRLVNRLEYGGTGAYYEDIEGNIKEISYLCPPIDYDSKTGKRLAEPVPDHLALRFADNRKTLTVEKLLKIIEAIFSKYIDTPDKYETEEAYEAANNDTKGILENIKEQINQAKDGKILLLTSSEYKERTKEKRTEI